MYRKDVLCHSIMSWVAIAHNERVNGLIGSADIETHT